MSKHGGHGIGLRAKHYRLALERGLGVPYIEAITENFLGRGGRPPAVLEKLSGEAHLVFHGVSLSIGGTDPLNLDYLMQLRALVDRFEPEVVSDHLCWSSFGGHYGHDLWPLPYTKEALEHVAARVMQVQALLGRQIALENPSRYVAFADDDFTEWDFFNELTRLTGCGMLLDVNNVYVTAHNVGFDAKEYLERIAHERVLQFHLAGHSQEGEYLLDDHGSPVGDAVWDLFAGVYSKCPGVPVIVEWDGVVPEVETVVAEAEKAVRLTQPQEVAA